MTIIESVNKFLSFGVATIPITYRDKRPDFKLLPKDAQNDPSWEVFKTILPSQNYLNKCYESGMHNYGVVTGWNNLVVIDFDDVREYINWLFWAKRNPATQSIADHAYQVKTARGVHVYVRLPHIERSRKIGKIDIKANGGYVLGPGSIHPTGIEYTPTKSTWCFPLINSLSEILPAALLIQDPTIPPVIPSQTKQPDIWDAVDNPFTFQDNLIAKIRNKYNILSFFPNAISTSHDNRWFMACCPFHDDKHPSFWINTHRKICSCMSGCTPKPLDVIDFIARLHGLSNREAIIYLAKTI
jgi:hypothetical protein